MALADVAVPELMGVTEVCEELGTKSSNLDKIAGLPEPLQRLAGGRVWVADEIRQFARERRERRRYMTNGGPIEEAE
jgi:hypothetical protein